MKKINWLDHTANLLVVILGISIAFYLERYKEAEDNRTQERKYLESLIKDLETDIQYLDTLNASNELISKALITLSNASLGRPYGNDSTLTNSLFLTQYNPPFSPQRITYESLKATGKMEIIGSFEIRNEVVDLYEQYYRGTREYDEAINQHLRDFLKPYYIQNVRFTSAKSVSPDFLFENEFRNMIFAYRNLFITKDDFYKSVKAKTTGVKQKLEEYLEEQ